MRALIRNRWFGLWVCVALLAGGKTIHNYSRGTYGLALAALRRSSPSRSQGQAARSAKGPLPAGGALATSGDLEPETFVPRLRLRAEKGIRGLAFTANGKELLGVGADTESTLWQVWDARNGATRRSYRADVGADDGPGRLAFAPEAGLMALVHNQAVRLWDLKAGTSRQLMTTSQGREVRLAFAGDGGQLAVGLNNGVMLYELPSGRQRLGVMVMIGELNALGFSPDGGSVAVAGELGKTMVFAAETGQSQRQLASLPGTVYSRRIAHLNFSPDGRFLAGIGKEDLAVWDLERGSLSWEKPGRDAFEPGVAFSPTEAGLLALSDRYHEVVRFWSARTKTWRGTLRVSNWRGVSALAFSPDGATLATANASLELDGTGVKLWDLAKYLESGEVKPGTSR